MWKVKVQLIKIPYADSSKNFCLDCKKLNNIQVDPKLWIPKLFFKPQSQIQQKSGKFSISVQCGSFSSQPQQKHPE